jgi:hypothetical protein
VLTVRAADSENLQHLPEIVKLTAKEMAPTYRGHLGVGQPVVRKTVLLA